MKDATSAAAPSVIWQPAALYTLYPLYAAGLWLAVIITPMPHFSLRVRKERKGVGISSRTMTTRMPLSAKMRAAVCAKSCDFLRLS